jgi:hypothetical protein
MRKRVLLAVSLIAAGLVGSVASAEPIIKPGLGTRGIAIPGMNQLALSPLAVCEARLTSSRSEASSLREELEDREQRIRELSEQVRRLTPGSCENRCLEGDRDGAEYAVCVNSCLVTEATIRAHSEITSEASRW